MLGFQVEFYKDGLTMNICNECYKEEEGDIGKALSIGLIKKPRETEMEYCDICEPDEPELCGTDPGVVVTLT